MFYIDYVQAIRNKRCIYVNLHNQTAINEYASYSNQNTLSDQSLHQDGPGPR
jgi:hypothetical protein